MSFKDLCVRTDLDEHLNIKTIRGECAYLLRPQLTSGSLALATSRVSPTLSRPIIMDLYRKLLTRAVHYLLMKQHVSGRVVMETSRIARLIAALAWCVRRSGASRVDCRGISSYARQP